MYALPDGYRSRIPARYAPAPGGPVWQPDVIPLAAEIADRLGATALVDVGCSTAAKLLPFADRFELVGLDLADQLPDDPLGEWIPCELEAVADLPVPYSILERSVIVCADVIEHLEDPARLAYALARALEWAPALVLSSPDRDRLYGPGHLGPPRNPCHAREWAADELRAFLEASGVPVVSRLWQRMTDRPNAAEATTVLVAGRDLCGVFDTEG